MPRYLYIPTQFVLPVNLNLLPEALAPLNANQPTSRDLVPLALVSIAFGFFNIQLRDPLCGTILQDMALFVVVPSWRHSCCDGSFILWYLHIMPAACFGDGRKFLIWEVEQQYHIAQIFMNQSVMPDLALVYCW